MLPHLGRDTGGNMRHEWDAYQRRSATLQGNYGTLQDRVGMVSGGAGGTRTPYLFNAIEALSQMSYSPKLSTRRGRRLQGNIAKALGSGKVATPGRQALLRDAPLRRSPTLLR